MAPASRASSTAGAAAAAELFVGAAAVAGASLDALVVVLSAVPLAEVAFVLPDARVVTLGLPTFLVA